MYAVVVADGSSILVLHPKQMIGVDNIDAELVCHVSYLERILLYFMEAHGQDHCKGRTLYLRVSGIVSNHIPHDVCKEFTNMCPCCIEHHQ